MNIRPRLTPSETMERILDVAEEQFRRVGYSKTAVADIAAELGMSAANIYRFFPSKLALNEAICKRLLDTCHTMVNAIIAEPAPAGERLKRMLTSMHAYNARCYVSERRMHEMVAVAMEENWSVIQAHLDFVVTRIADLIVEGVQSGEFRSVDDPIQTALTVKQACGSILHPLMIAECARHGLNEPEQAARIADFALSALRK